MNKVDFYMFDDPREKALRDAVLRAIATLARRDSARSEDVLGEKSPERELATSTA